MKLYGGDLVISNCLQVDCFEGIRLFIRLSILIMNNMILNTSKMCSGSDYSLAGILLVLNLREVIRKLLRASHPIFHYHLKSLAGKTD